MCVHTFDKFHLSHKRIFIKRILFPVLMFTCVYFQSHHHTTLLQTPWPDCWNVCCSVLQVNFIIIYSFVILLKFSPFLDQSNCFVASTMTQFFEMASEAWLLCIGLDLFFSMTQPFSSFESRYILWHTIQTYYFPNFFFYCAYIVWVRLVVYNC